MATPISWPVGGKVSVGSVWTPPSGTVISRATSAAIQVADFQDGLWRLSMTLGPNYPQWRMREVQRTLAVIAHGAPINIPVDEQWTDVPGAGSGAVAVNGANQVGDSISTNGWVDGLVLESGWKVSFLVGERWDMFTLKADATAAGGVATLSIDPPILAGQSPADASQVRYNKRGTTHETLVTMAWVNAESAGARTTHVLAHAQLRLEFEGWGPKGP